MWPHFLRESLKAQRFVVAESEKAEVCFWSCQALRVDHPICQPHHMLHHLTLVFPRCTPGPSKCCAVELWDEFPHLPFRPCAMVVPYLSGVHAGTSSGSAPWARLAHADRPTLLVFVGGTWRGGRDQWLAHYHRAAANLTALHPRAFEAPQVMATPKAENRQNIMSPKFYADAWNAYAQAMFSLQPPGDTLTRRAFYDSWLHGCIPVVTTEAAAQYALLFNGAIFRNPDELGQVVVIVSGAEMRDGSENLMRKLALMPAQEVRERQRLLRQHAFALQYSLSAPSPHHGDAWDLVMRAARAQHAGSHQGVARVKGTVHEPEPKHTLPTHNSRAPTV